MAADETFTILMGEKVEPRKEFNREQRPIRGQSGLLIFKKGGCPSAARPINMPNGGPKKGEIRYMSKSPNTIPRRSVPRTEDRGRHPGTRDGEILH